jgi:hypothetical protein
MKTKHPFIYIYIYIYFDVLTKTGYFNTEFVSYGIKIQTNIKPF